MKEVFRPELTNQTASSHNGGRGNIFMPQDNQGEIPKPEPKPSAQSSQERILPSGRRLTPEQQQIIQEFWGEAIKRGVVSQEEGEEAVELGIPPISGGAEPEAPVAEPAGVGRRSPFEEIPEPIVPEVMEPGETAEEFAARQRRARGEQTQRQALERAFWGGMLNPQDEFNKLNDAITRGEITPDKAEPYLNWLTQAATAEMAQRQQRMTPDRLEFELLEGIEQTQVGTYERTQALKNAVDRLSPDLGGIYQQLLQRIAEDDEASEKFVDKIIAKPFASPEADYKLSWYADINLQAFFTEISRTRQARLEHYVRKSEAALRFHQMNKTIISESGNPDAFQQITRSVTPQHIQVASTEDAVEVVRQLTDQAYARLYARENRVSGTNFDPDINQWVERRFMEMVAKGIVKSSFKVRDAEGNEVNRNLEDWEIRRALALGRYIHASFYRHSELIAWSNIPEDWEGWIKSMPTETVVRVLAGAKWLSRRFRIGMVGGGPAFMQLLYDKIQKADYKTKLTHIGTLDIKEDILPVRFFRGGGFDRGWRTLVAYLDSPLMQIKIKPGDFPREVQDSIKEFLSEHPEYENETGKLGTFLFRQEYLAQIAAAEGVEINGVKLSDEYAPFNDKKQEKAVQKIMEKILPQLNLSLGVLISYGGSNEAVRGQLWAKAAEFLPLRLAYFLSEEGVKRLSGYSRFKGAGGNLLNEDFESKVLMAQRLRIEEQKKDPKRPVTLENYKRRMPDGSEEDVNFLDQAGFTEEEKGFVRQLQRLGKENANELGKINFPHIPFLDDVPFQDADYLELGAEVFPRRMGGDFRAFSEASNGLIGVVANLAQPYEEILKNLDHIVDSMSTPENEKIGQDVAAPILQTYLEMAEQWAVTKVPFVKTIVNFLGLPTSHLQRFFGPNARSDDESEVNVAVRQAQEKGILRRIKQPGEDKSQVDEILEHLGGKWYNVMWRETRNALLLFFILSMFEFGKKVSSERTQ